MKGFFKYVFASTVGFIFGYIILFVISIFLVIGVVSFVGNKAKGDKDVKVKEKTILNISLNTPIVERTDDNPFMDLDIFGDDNYFPLSLQDILRNIRKAKNDDRISGIFLNLSIVPARFATLEEVRNALVDFKSSGKFIYAYSEIMTENAYYLASVADKIYMEPEGMFTFDGFQSEVSYIKGTLEKLNIEPKLIKVGEYKSAGEMFIRESMSDENRKQLEEFLNPLWKNWLNHISESRGISVSKLDSIADGYEVRNIEAAVALKLIDGAKYYDEVLDELKAKTGTDKLNQMNLVKYKRAHLERKEKREYTKDKIAVIYATGNINMGTGSAQSVGSASLSKAIRKARLNDKVKAIVLRINSPGGSALASDIIWREVKLAADAKPLVVSMGDYAASGGYYIAAPADTIVAQPTTLTGSIGVFGMFFNMQDFWKDKMGVTFDRVQTNRYANFGSPNRPMLPEEEIILQGFINEIYEDFVARVGEGRGLDTAFVNSIARGRIWSGEQAKEKGLVDVLGGFEDAIRIAAEMAKLENYRISVLPKLKNPIEEVFGSWGASIKDKVVETTLKEDYHLYKTIKETREMNGPYMIMPFDLNVK